MWTCFLQKWKTWDTLCCVTLWLNCACSFCGLLWSYLYADLQFAEFEVERDYYNNEV